MEWVCLSVRWSSLAALVAALALFPGGDVTAQEEPAAAAKPMRPPPTAEQLAAWVQQLDADEFLARETAMIGLIDAGPAAIPALKSAAQLPRSVEAATRVMHVLQTLGLSPDFDVQEASRAALTDLAARKELPVIARRAATTLEELTERRSAQSLIELESLGAIISRGETFNGLITEQYIYAIKLGPDFRGSDADLRRLKWLPETRALVLSGPKATDAWLQHAAGMARLSELHLYQAAATDAGLAPFENHATLTQVGIYYTPVTKNCLTPLTKLPALNFVKLYGTEVSISAVEKFRADTGLTKVDHRKGAFLGVGCQNLDGACLISTVHENSPAERAGLERDDQFVRFGTVKVADFDSLTAEISQRDAGEEVEVEVLRQVLDDEGKIVPRAVVTKVKLGPWEQDLAVENGMRP